jgi:hypothetical protein
MNHYEPGGGISYPRRRDDWMRDHPLASRLLIMIAGFAVLVPIGLVIKASQGNVVRSGGLPGAAMAADPVILPSSTSSSVAGVAAAAAGAAGASAASAPPSVDSATASTITSAPASPSSVPATVAAEQVAPSTTAKKATPATAAAPVTTAAKKPATTAAAAPKPTSPPTTRPAPTTTRPPPTTTTEAVAAPPANTYSKADVEAIIRSVFPPEEADEAVRIATRESHLVPTVRNWCCYGLFQIYFEMNRTTLAAIGVTSPERLYDPTVNAQAAYAIFQRSGWAPWR